MKCTEELLEEVRDLYQNAGYGYRRIVQYLDETHNLSISHMAVKKWIEKMGLEKHEPKRTKVFSKSWYARDYARLEQELIKLQNKYLQLSTEKENLEREIVYLRDELGLLRNQNTELRKIAVKAFRAGLICKEVFKKVTKII